MMLFVIGTLLSLVNVSWCMALPNQFTSSENDRYPKRLVAFLESFDGGDVRGVVRFTQYSVWDNRIFVEGEIYGLKPGLHGFHVHEYGNITGGCKSTGGHFNPFGANHGGPNDPDRHIGDLGNIIADASGVAKIKIVDALLSRNIIGRAVVVHANEDDLGKGGYPDSLKTGHAGGRVACGLIGIGDGARGY